MADPFDCATVWRARGRGFSMGLVQPEGRIVHLTGQVAWDEHEQVVGVGDVGAQTRQCFENIRRLLTEVGGDLADIVSITTYLTDRSQLPIVQSVRRELLQQAAAPVSTSVIVTGLSHPDFLVELTPIAVIPTERFRAPRS